MAKRVISAVLTLKDQNFSSGLRGAAKNMTDFDRSIMATKNKINNFASGVASKLKEVGVATGALASGVVTGLAGAVGKSILDMDSSFAQLQAQTGLMGAELAALEEAAIDTFKRGYGESLDEVTSAVARVKQNMHNLDNDEIANVTANALLLAKTFESDVNEVTRGVNNTMEAFGISSEKAFDLFTAGGQRGLNFSNEMFDNMAEFAPLAKQMGYTAEEYFGILERGSQAGVYNLSYVNDALKEFQITIKDGSSATSDAMSLLSTGTQGVWKDFLAGKATVSDVASSVVGELKSMDNQVLANQIGVGLFKTKWEDLESDAMYAMLGSTKAMEDFEGATANAANSIEGGFINRLKSSYRDLTTSIATLAGDGSGKEFFDSIATAAENLVPKITSIAEKAMEFGNTIRDNWPTITDTASKLVPVVAGAAAAFTTLKVVSVVTTALNLYKTSAFASTVATQGFNAALRANPIGMVVTAIGLLVAGGVMLYQNWDTVKEKAVALWGIIRSNPITAFLTQPIQNAIDFGVMLYQNWDTIKASAVALWTVTKEKFAGIKESISNAIQPILGWFDSLKGKWDAFKGAISNFKLPDWVNKLGGGAVGWVMDKVQGSYAVGTNNVPNDMVAQIHKGEMIIPARQAQRLREQGVTIDNIDGAKTASVVTTTNTTNNRPVEVHIHNINAKGTTANEVVKELVPQLKLALANM